MKLSEVCKDLIKKWRKGDEYWIHASGSPYGIGYNQALADCATELEKNLPKPLVHTFLRLGKNPRLYKVEDEHRHFYLSNPSDYILLGTNLTSDQILNIMYKETKPTHYHDYFSISQGKGSLFSW